MDQHTWVRQCTNYYEEQGLTPGDPNDGDWDECHYPEPEGVGDETVWLLHEHHQPQGLWQSEEYNRCCFFNGDVCKFLTQGPFVPGWFELWNLYNKWKGHNSRSQPREVKLKICEKTTPAMNAHANTIAARSEIGKKTGRRNVEVARAFLTPETLREGGRKNGAENGRKKSKRVLCVETGVVHPSTREASRRTNIRQSGISQSCRTGCRAGGYHWQFAEG